MSRRQVLLVDDDETIRALLRATLPDRDLEIVDARDGQEALDRVEARAPELVVLDWKMPGRSGEDVLRVLKQAHPHVPVIVLTSQRHERELAESLGADEFLTKPFSPLQLLGTIERLLRLG